jgi:hypothetical protein
MSTTLRIFSNMHVKNEVANVKCGDWIVLENNVSRMRWRSYFKKQNIDEESLNITYITAEEYFKLSKKFSVIVANPPYSGTSELHQRFFNKAVDLTEDDGHITFIQPAVPYFNKKDTKKDASATMLKNVGNHHSTVQIIDKNVFAGVAMPTSLAITTLVKDNNNSGVVDTFIAEDRTTYSAIKIDNINMLNMAPNIFGTLISLSKSWTKKNGSIHSLVSTDTSVKKLYIQKVRGNIGKNDFFSFISANQAYWKIGPEHDYGLVSSNYDSLISYLTSFSARAFLSLYKTNSSSHRGELKGVPLVPFDRIWNDKMLCEYFGITDTEYREILRCIPDYYGLGDNLG